MNQWIRVAIAVVAVGLVASGCGSDKKVGDQSLLNGTSGSSVTRLGQTTTSTAPPNASTTAVAPTAPPATAPPTTGAPQVAITVTINSDTTSGGQFQPTLAKLPSGSILRFVNKDSSPRSVLADNGAFDSGPIAPGASYDWLAGKPGTYNYSDGTRPYAVGSVEVS